MHNEMARAKRQTMILIVVAALVLPLALAAVGLWTWWRASQQPAVDPAMAEALQASLERAADVVMPAPTLGAEALVVEPPADQVEEELQRVVRLARGVGGSASSWNDGQTIRIIASVPVSAEDLFRDAVTRGVYDLKTAGDTRAVTMVEVLIRPVAPPPPAKKRSGQKSAR